MATTPDTTDPDDTASPVDETPVAKSGVTTRAPLWALALTAVAAIAVGLVALALLGGESLPTRNGPPVEKLAVERTVLRPSEIDVTVRNVGVDPVRIAQVFITATVRLTYPWQDGQPYIVSLLTSSGQVIEHSIPAAVATPSSTGTLGLMALLGAYVGIIPIALGMLVLPLLRRSGPLVVRVLLALTVGLLAFLAVDGGIEAIEQGQLSGRAFGGPALVVLGAGLAFLVLTAIDGVLQKRRRRTDPSRPGGVRLAAMIAVGIGLHNLGEGLAIGSAYAVGELALGAFLVIGFALHNTTEGIAIVAPLATQRPPLLQLTALGLLAGVPAIPGAVLGATVVNTELSALLLGVGVGAIAHVIVQITRVLRPSSGQKLGPETIGAITAGALVMYLTGLLVAA
jgi:ZIP family zinc transporter